MTGFDKTPYTPGMREVLRLSRFVAEESGLNFVEPEHLMLGILRKGDGLAIKALTFLKIELPYLKWEIERLISEKQSGFPEALLGSPEHKRVLDAAIATAKSMRHGWVGTEHLLLGLIQVEGTIPARVLRDKGLTFEQIKKSVVAIIEGPHTTPKI